MTHKLAPAEEVFRRPVCPHCDEPVLPAQEREIRPHVVAPDKWENRTYHIECAARGIIGSLCHLKRECSCFVPGSDHLDPPDMTRREAAVAAWNYFQEHGPTVR